MELLTVLIGIVSLEIVVTHVTKKIDIFKNTVLSIALFFMAYCVISDVLIGASIFSIRIATIITTLITAIACVIFIVKNCKNNEQFEYVKIIEYTYLLPAVLVGTFLTAHSFDFYGMGQDEGVYQTEAINFYYDNNKWSHPIEEVDKLTDLEYKQFMVESLSGWLGYDMGFDLDEIYSPGFKYDENYTVNGMWHGLPSFAAMLGLTARILDISHMMFINYIFYICFISVLGFVIKKIGLGDLQVALITLLGAVCPIIVWVAKSALTEMFFALLVATYLYLVLNDNKYKKYSILPAIAVMFFHISAYMLVPLFLLVYWYLYIDTKDKVYLYLSYIVVIIYGASFLLIASIQPIYTLKNIAWMLKVESKYTPWLVLVACLVGILITFAIGKLKRDTDCVNAILKKVLSIIVILGLLYPIVLSVKRGYTLQEWRMMTMVVYAVLTGVLLLPFIIVTILCNKRKCEVEENIIYLCFVWMVIAFSFFRPDIAYYYYYSRYVAPYVIVVYIALAFSIYKYELNFIKKYKKITFNILSVIGIIILLPFSFIISNNKDDSRLEWDVFESTIKEVERLKEESEIPIKAAVDCGYFGLTMYYPIRAVVDECYILNDKDDVKKLREQGIEPDIIVSQNDFSDDSLLSLVYKQDSVITEDDLSQRSRVLALPTAFTMTNRYSVNVYKSLLVDTIKASDINSGIFQSGWASPDNSGNRWTNDVVSDIKINLRKEDTELTLVFGNAVPFENISINKMDVKALANGNVVDKFSIDNQDEIKISIPRKFIVDGENIIQFQTDVSWSPEEFGSEDKSQYGFSLNELKIDSMHK